MMKPIFVILDLLKRHKLPNILIKLKFQIRNSSLAAQQQQIILCKKH